MTENIVVTGGASFIGSHLVEKLVSRNNHVTVIDDLSSGKLEFLNNVKDKINFSQINIKSYTNQVFHLFKDADKVFHLANAHGGRGWIHSHPAQCCENMAVDNLIFELATKAGVKNVQYTSSACVYPLNYQKKGEYQPLKEEFIDYNDLVSADEEYGLAKLMGEVSLIAHKKEFGLKGSAMRLSSIYGPRENETHAVVALIAKALIHQDPYEVYGDGNQVRNFTYIDDVVECMIRASDKITDCTAINLGTMEIITINEFIELIFEYMNWKPKEINHDLTKPTGAYARVVNNKLASQLLGFENWTTIQEGLKKTIDWYIETHNVYEVKRNLTVLLNER